MTSNIHKIMMNTSGACVYSEMHWPSYLIIKSYLSATQTPKMHHVFMVLTKLTWTAKVSAWKWHLQHYVHKNRMIPYKQHSYFLTQCVESKARIYTWVGIVFILAGTLNRHFSVITFQAHLLWWCIYMMVSRWRCYQT